MLENSTGYLGDLGSSMLARSQEEKGDHEGEK